MTTSVPTATATIRGACRHDPTTTTTQPRVAPAMHAVPSDRGTVAAGAPDAETTWPIIDLSDLLTGVADVPCQENDAELWFAESPDDVEFAKSLCGTCPARETCLQGALARREPWGVWGGELFVMGQVVPRKRPRGRPRKDAVA